MIFRHYTVGSTIYNESPLKSEEARKKKQKKKGAYLEYLVELPIIFIFNRPMDLSYKLFEET